MLSTALLLARQALPDLGGSSRQALPIMCSVQQSAVAAISTSLGGRLGFSSLQEGQQSATSGSLTPEQRKQVQAAVAKGTAAVSQLQRLVTLAGATGHYRDIVVSMEALYVQQVQGKHPLTAAPLGSALLAPDKAALCSTAFPMVDVTRIPDSDPKVPQGEPLYDDRLMDKITCWMQTQPNHVETSSLLQTSITLFPPQEATFPTYVDFTAAMKLLDFHKSRKRMTRLRRLRKHARDMYQLSTWQHTGGE